LKCAPGNRSEHEDDREEASRGRGGVLKQLESDVVRGELLGGDAGADHDRGQERRSE
jgi:hypothetical protein